MIRPQTDGEVEYVAEDEFEESDLSDMEVSLFCLPKK